MKIIIYLLLIILLVSCGKDKEIKAPLLLKDSGSKIENTIDDEKVMQIKELLKVEKNINLVMETGSKNEVLKTITPRKTNDISLTENSIGTGILTEEEINIIENTTDGEIDELIDILFKDLN